MECQWLRPTLAELGHSVFEFSPDGVPEIDIQGGLNLIQALGGESFADLVCIRREELGANKGRDNSLVALDDLELTSGALGKSCNHRLPTEKRDVLPEYSGSKHIPLNKNS